MNEHTADVLENLVAEAANGNGYAAMFGLQIATSDDPDATLDAMIESLRPLVDILREVGEWGRRLRVELDSRGF